MQDAKLVITFTGYSGHDNICATIWVKGHGESFPYNGSRRYKLFKHLIDDIKFDLERESHSAKLSAEIGDALALAIRHILRKRDIWKGEYERWMKMTPRGMCEDLLPKLIADNL